MTAQIVAAVFNTLTSNEINISIKDSFELGFHLVEGAKCGVGFWVKLYHYINVAISAKIVTQNRPKEGKFYHLPLMAKFGDFF